MAGTSIDLVFCHALLHCSILQWSLEYHSHLLPNQVSFESLHSVSALAALEAACLNNTEASFQSLAVLFSAALLLLFLLLNFEAVLSLVVVQFSHSAAGLANCLSELLLEESSAPSQFPAVLDAQFPAVVSVLLEVFLLLLQNDLPMVLSRIFSLTAAAVVVEDLASKKMMLLRLDPLYHAVLASPVVVLLHLEGIVWLALEELMVLLSSFVL